MDLKTIRGWLPGEERAIEKIKAVVFAMCALAEGVYAIQGVIASIILLYSTGVMATAQTMGGVVLQAGGGGGGGGTDVTNSLSTALCNIGIGAIITAILFLISLALIYGSLGDLYRWFSASHSKDSGRRSESGDHLGGAGKKLVGGIVIGASPTILSAIGFNLLACVSAVNPFA